MLAVPLTDPVYMSDSHCEKYLLYAMQLSVFQLYFSKIIILHTFGFHFGVETVDADCIKLLSMKLQLVYMTKIQ